MAIIKYKGKKISCTKITEDKIDKCKGDFKRVTGYGNVEIGKYLWYTGCGFDRFYQVLSENEIEIVE